MSFAVLDELEPRRVDELLALYRHGWWTDHRSRADVERMLAGTDELFVLIEYGFTDSVAGSNLMRRSA